MEGFIVLHRKMLDWEWYDDTNMVRLWLHLLLMANFREKSWHGQKIKRGQLVTGREELANQTGLSVQQVRTCLDRLINCGCITKKTTNRYTLITIAKYSKYQDVPEKNNQLSTNYQPTINQQITTTKQRNKETSNNTTPTPAREEENSREEKNKEWQGSEVVTENDIPPLTDLWVEEIKLLITRQLKRTISEREISEHYQDFIAQERSPYLQVLYSDWRVHFKRYIRKRLKAIKDETSTANRQHLSRDEQRKREADARKQRAAEHVAELTSTCT